MLRSLFRLLRNMDNQEIQNEKSMSTTAVRRA
jgi:hypothetical protein